MVNAKIVTFRAKVNRILVSKLERKITLGNLYGDTKTVDVEDCTLL